jgi:hypothetical protein
MLGFGDTPWSSKRLERIYKVGTDGILYVLSCLLGETAVLDCRKEYW